MKNSIRNILSFISSIIVAYTLSLNINDYTNFNYYFNNSLIPIILTIGTFILIKKTWSITDDKIKSIAFTEALIIGITVVLGNCIHCNLDLSNIIFNDTIRIKSILYFITTLVISSIIIINIYTYFNTIKPSKWHFKDSKLTYLIIWLLIFIMWLPYFLSWYPSVMTPDSINQFEQAIGIRQLTNNLPIIHTLFIKLCIFISAPFSNYTTAAAVYSIIQMLIMSLIFTLAIKWMIKNNINSIIIILAIIFYALYPVNAIYSFTMWKDIIYSGLLLIFMLMAYNTIQKKDYLSNTKNYILFILVMILITLFRNNGFLVLIPVLLILILKLKDIRSLLTKSLIILVTFSLVWFLSLSYIFKIPTTSTIDAFSVPLQQVARIYVKKNSQLNNYEKRTIQKYLNEKVIEYYNPRLSDNVKDHFNLTAYKENKLSFITLWLSLIIKYPITGVESFLYNNYGYWYPRAQNWVISYGIIETEQDWQLKNGPVETWLINSKYINTIWTSIDNRQIPIIPMFYSIGLMSWLILIMMSYTIYKKETKTFLTYVPIIIVFIHCLLSPVWAEFRYYYPIVICLPVIIAVSTKKHKV